MLVIMGTPLVNWGPDTCACDRCPSRSLKKRAKHMAEVINASSSASESESEEINVDHEGERA